MSTLIQQVRARDVARTTFPLTGQRCLASNEIDPLLDRAMALARIGAWSCRLADNELSWTSGVYDIFGLPVGTALDRRQTIEMYTEETREEMERLRAEAIAAGGAINLTAQIKRPDGEMRWMRINGEVTRDAGGAQILHGLKRDATEEKQRLETLRQLAENDSLTGLASRAVYEARFLNTRVGSPLLAPLGALVLFDLDGFKEINDRLGHLAGDACLKVFAERLSACFPQALLTARIGGDEFAVIVRDNELPDLLQARVDRFLVQLRAPIIWREHIFTVGATSGIAVATDPHSYDPEELFATTDAALYAAKNKRGTVRSSSRARRRPTARGPIHGPWIEQQIG